jgi:integrase/recombinase XerD
MAGEIVKIGPGSLVQAEPEVVGADSDAIEAWLAIYELRSAHTVRAFRREAQRWLLWLDATLGPGDGMLARAGAREATAYVQFLAAPREFSAELLARHGWRDQPFRGPLTAASARQAVRILHAMYEAMREMPETGIARNPWRLARKAARPAESDELGKALSASEWQAVLDAVDALPQTSDRDRAHHSRARWVMQLLYRGWLRREEACRLAMGDIQLRPDGWRMHVTGKGGRSAWLIVSARLLEELVRYRRSLGLPDLPVPGDPRPAIVPVIGEAGHVSPQLVYLMCKTLFGAAADRLQVSAPQSAARLRVASPHWLRHTGISHGMEAGADPRVVQQHARHASLTMTARYDHKEQRRAREQIDRL